MIWTSNHLRLDKAVLFVSVDQQACSSAQRIAKFHGVRMQTATSCKSAISFLEYSSQDYFLAIIDVDVCCSDGLPLIQTVQVVWPDLKTVSLSSEVQCFSSLNELEQKTDALRKPLSDEQFNRLIKNVRDDFLKNNISLREVVNERVNALEKGIQSALPGQDGWQKLVPFSREYQAACERVWLQSGRYPNRLFARDSEQFQQHLNRCIFEAVERASSKRIKCPKGQQFHLSTLLNQFGIKRDRTIDRVVEQDEAAVVSMISVLEDYYSILGYDIGQMISPQSQSILCYLGGRFTYNDLFNPLLSHVERGVELACLKLEFFLRAYLADLEVELSFDDSFSLSLVC